MTTEAKKLSMIRKIMNLTGEEAVNRVYHWMEEKPMEGGQDLLTKFATDIEPTFDLEKVKAEQGYHPIDKQKMEKLIKEADIQESTDELLAML